MKNLEQARFKFDEICSAMDLSRSRDWGVTDEVVELLDCARDISLEMEEASNFIQKVKYAIDDLTDE